MTEKDCVFYLEGYCDLWKKDCIKLPCSEFLSQDDYEEQCKKDDETKKELEAEELKEKRELGKIITGDYNYCNRCLSPEFTLDNGICTCTECGHQWNDRETEQVQSL